jgi:hypothetical protein
MRFDERVADRLPMRLPMIPAGHNNPRSIRISEQINADQ